MVFAKITCKESSHCVTISRAHCPALELGLISSSDSDVFMVAKSMNGMICSPVETVWHAGHVAFITQLCLVASGGWVQQNTTPPESRSCCVHATNVRPSILENLARYGGRLLRQTGSNSRKYIIFVISAL